MKEQIKRYSRGINIFSFILALILGITAGILIGKGKNKVIDSDPQILSDSGIELIQSDFFTGLIIGLDDLTIANPTLESAWWLSYDQLNQLFHLMPLYPVLPINAPENLLIYLAPHDPIIFSSPEISTIVYHEVFSSYSLSWDFTLLLDRFALDEMLNNYSELSADSSSLKIDYLNSLNPSLPGKDPSAALSYQRKLFEILCEDPVPLLTEKWIDYFFDLNAHFRSDLDFNEILIMRDTIKNSPITANCKFSWQ